MGVLFSEIRSTAQLWLCLRRSLRVTGRGIRRLAQAVPFSMGMTAKRFKTNFKLLRFNKQKRQARRACLLQLWYSGLRSGGEPAGAFRNSILGLQKFKK